MKLITLGLLLVVVCASNGNTTSDTSSTYDDDSVIVEAADLGAIARKSRQSDHPTNHLANWSPSTCLNSKGVLGSCTSFKQCYPYFKIPNLGLWESWVLGNYDTCHYSVNGEAAFGVCCTNLLPVPPGMGDGPASGDLKPTEDRGNDREDNHGSGTVPNWPPPIPTHPPDHTAATHPPNLAHETTSSKPAMTTTSKRPVHTTWPTKTTYPSWSPPTTAAKPQVTTTTTKKPSEVPAPPPLNVACGARNIIDDAERIVGGDNAAPNSWPWIVVLFNSGRQFCGASLIDNVHVLTAAHCVAHMSSWDVARLTAHLGDYDIRTQTETQHVTRKIKRLVRHKGFDSRTLYNDVAILTLDKPVQFTHNIRPICLPDSTRQFHGKTATVIGWGSLRENGPQPAKLQEVSIQVWSNHECAAKYGPAAPGGIIETMLCAGASNRDSCSGDSGGPLMISDGKWVQAGIVSWGIGCGKGQYPGVYTRVTHFLPWIRKNLEI